MAQRYGIERIDAQTLERWRADETRTLYLFDVRDPPEYAAGHVAGAISAPGGQLVQATDQYVGTLGARIVLVDDADVRAVMTASWLKQMGWKDVFVLVASRTRETGAPDESWCSARTAAGVRDRRATDLPSCSPATKRPSIDLSLSPNYRKGHIPGAWFAIRSRLAQALPKIPLRGELVLTSEDGVLAGLAVAGGARARPAFPCAISTGGNAAWQARQAIRSRPSRAWPTTPSTSGSSPTSAPATPTAR